MISGGDRTRGLAPFFVLCFAGVSAEAHDLTLGDAAQPTVAAPVTLHAASTPVACVPRCRSGYTCIDGACVSACNPPCAAGDTCDASGQCTNPEREREAHSIRRHDGFYLRLELGAGYLSGSRVTDMADNRLHGDVMGIAQVGGLMLGGTVAPGLVLGGGAWGTNAPRAEYSGQVLALDRTRFAIGEGTVGVDLASTSIIGPFVAWYPNPTKGLNAELALGLAIASSSSGYEENEAFGLDSHSAAGWGLQVAVGYDFWIGEQWSLGLAARVSYVNTSSTDSPEMMTVWTPALAGAATFH